MSKKADYVKDQPNTGDHQCHWPSCEEHVPPAMWGCKKHWLMLPIRIRVHIWAEYRPGQEIDKVPSAAYLDAAKAAQDWIKTQQEKED